ncbi:MAG: hypothetical protein IJ980_00845 [Oscillospiraceae bacterium]|nr:hypothetical protein [Oscillospiraceae bacterium]
MRYGKILLTAMALFLSLCLSGCLTLSVDEMYTLPRQSDEYNELQSAINETLKEGLQYASPVSGANQQPIQLADLTGDGLDEAIVFTKADGVKPLRAQIFAREGEGYTRLCSIDGDGSAFDRVEYVQLDGEPGLEIVLGRRIGNQVLQSVGAYALLDGQLTELMSANYTEFRITDLDGDDARDLFLIRFDAENTTAVAEVYRFFNGAMERSTEVPLSADASALRHITTGNLQEGRRAVFVASTSAEELVVTDVFTLDDGKLNVRRSDLDYGLYNCPVRGYSVYANDLDGDGLLELPNVVLLNPYSEEAADDKFYAIEWHSVAGGSPKYKLTTYHNHSSGWYLTMPKKLGSRFIVRRGDTVAGARGLEFYTDRTGRPGESVFTLYAFSGDNRGTLAAQDGRFALGAKNEVTYCAMLGDAAERLGVTQEELSTMFRFIRVNWDPGET